MNLKNFNILNITGNLLPNSLRVPNVIGYVSHLLSPIKFSHSDIYNFFYDDETEKAKRSSLVPLYEETLNTEFGLSFSFGITNSIFITHEGETLEQLYLFEDTESEKTYFYEESEQSVYLFTLQENESEFDYEVNIDSTQNINENRLLELINKINLWGKRFIIKKY